jgi:pimeloyl-ACP methyl ester carboxylesterase
MQRRSRFSVLLKWGSVSLGVIWGAARLVQVKDRESQGEEQLESQVHGFTPRWDIRSADGTPIFAGHAGEGPTVFLVHGITCNGSIWRYQVPYLSKQYRVVTLDLRGHGRSGIPENGDHSTERLAEDLEAVVEAYDPGEFVLAGHSMGGFTVFKWLERFAPGWRGRLKGVVILNSSALPLTEGMILGWVIDSLYPFPLSRLIEFLQVPRPAAQKAVAAFWKSDPGYLLMRYVAFGKNPPAREVDFQRQMTASTPLHCFARAARACLEYRVDHSALTKLDVPSLVITSTHDRLISAASSRRTSELMPGSRLVVFRDVGHDTPLECPGELQRELERFLSLCFDHRQA